MWALRKRFKINIRGYDIRLLHIGASKLYNLFDFASLIYNGDYNSVMVKFYIEELKRSSSLQRLSVVIQYSIFLVQRIIPLLGNYKNLVSNRIFNDPRFDNRRCYIEGIIGFFTPNWLLFYYSNNETLSHLVAQWFR